jgi:hypothetical protein
LCIETFNKDPMHYLRLRNVHEISTAMRHREQEP